MTYDPQLAATMAAAQQQTSALKRQHYGDQRAAYLITTLAAGTVPAERIVHHA